MSKERRSHENVDEGPRSPFGWNDWKNRCSAKEALVRLVPSQQHSEPPIPALQNGASLVPRVLPRKLTALIL